MSRPAAKSILALAVAMATQWSYGTEEILNDQGSGAGSEIEEVYIVGLRDNRVSKGATGLAMSLYETPQSVTVMDQAFIEGFGLDDVNHALKFITGVNVDETETDRTYYNSRGFDIKSMQVDGIGMPFNWNVVGALDTAVYEKIEVIRGANGLLTGTGNPSGTINYIRKRPTNEFKASTEFTLGAWGKQRGELDVSAPFTDSGTWAGRIVIASQDADSYLKLYSTNRDIFYGVVDGQLGESSTITFGYTDQTNKAQSPLWGALPLLYTNGEQTNYPTSTTTSMPWAFYDTSNKTGFVEYTHKLGGGWEFKTVYTHSEYEEPSELFYVYGEPDKDTGLGLFGWPGKYFNESKRDLLDVTLSGSFEFGGRSQDILIGFSGSKADSGYLEYHAPSDDPAWGALPAFPGWSGREIARPDFGPAQVAGDWNDDLRRLYIITHLRATDRLDFVLGANSIDNSTRGFNFGDSMAKDEQQTSPYFGVNYQLASNIKLYGSYSDIFEPQADINEQLKPLGAAQGKSYELGVKSQWFDEQLLTSFAVFKADQSNYAEFAGHNDEHNVDYSKGIDVVSEGYELEASGKITDHWHLLAGFTKVDLDDGHGNQVRTFVPGKTFNFGARYTPTAALEIGASWRWQDDIHTGAIKQEAYGVGSAYITYAVSNHIKLALNLNNVTDEKYLTSLYWSQSFYGAPRNASASVKVSF
ncbi:ligand-gated channel protein [Cellvibrio zantedeschiae]|uniref:Ligand-gated channel protein n=1 Tax=Cellvibrio zantedeschiae TaxID=1237077 RepID=A0ABQ3B4X7_9GAMM|nr:TonB-dependent siderophore receptor [Cellvibrio zantedeschiae]GGY77237.1 ligand-gated channel protein [Cellvibrio zantedeschiae]